jgi:hypothetical protein
VQCELAKRATAACLPDAPTRFQTGASVTRRQRNGENVMIPVSYRRQGRLLDIPLPLVSLRLQRGEALEPIEK